MAAYGPLSSLLLSSWERTPSGVLAQRTVVFWFCFSIMGQIWVWSWILLRLRGTVPLACLAVYLAYIWYGPGAQASRQTDNWPKWLQKWSAWKLMRDYFSARLVRTVPLDPRGNYIFGVHPHGITAASGFINFCTEATGTPELFPGLDIYCCTLASNFKAPLIREYCLLLGLRSCERSAIRNMLSCGPGKSVMLAVGGAAESLLAAPGTCDLVLRSRKGFVRLALETGASLVPVFAFGENELFDTLVPQPGTLLYKYTQMIKHVCGFTTPFFCGVGLTGGWGLLPRGLPLTTVVGAPLAVPKYEGPAEGMDALVNKYHAMYLEALQQLYDTHKDAYAPCRRKSMQIL